MGVKNSPDTFQAIMDDLEYCRAYIDVLLIVSDGSFQDHNVIHSAGAGSTKNTGAMHSLL